jgi:hypothetical protein
MKSIVAITIALVAVGTVQSQAATTTPTPKPALSGAPHRGGFGGGQNSAAFAKYQACLTKAGIKLPAFGGFGGQRTRPTGAPTTRTTPRPRQSLALTPAQQKAFTACAPLRPSFSGFGGNPAARGVSGSKSPSAKASTAPKAIAPKIGTSAAYFACLNAHGMPVKTAAEVKGLDSQNTKVIAAEKACAGK